MGYLDYANKIFSNDDLNEETKQALLKHCIWDIPQENNRELNEVRKTLFAIIKSLEPLLRWTRESPIYVELDEAEKKKN